MWEYLPYAAILFAPLRLQIFLVVPHLLQCQL